jgi:hypothetical protein
MVRSSGGTSKLARFGLGPLMGALLGLGLLLGGCAENSPDVDDEVDAEQVGELNDALLAGEIELDDVDGDGDIDADDMEELLLDLQASKRSQPGDESSFGAPDEGNDPSPQPWVPADDGDPESDAEAKASHVF